MAKKTRRKIRVVTDRYNQKHGQRWTDDEITTLLYLHLEEQLTTYSVATILSRSIKGCEDKLRSAGLTTSRRD